MTKQIIEWRIDFHNITPTTKYVEKMLSSENIYDSTGAVLIECRGKFHAGYFILQDGEWVFLLDNGMRLGMKLVSRFAFLE